MYRISCSTKKEGTKEILENCPFQLLKNIKSHLKIVKDFCFVSIVSCFFDWSHLHHMYISHNLPIY